MTTKIGCGGFHLFTTTTVVVVSMAFEIICDLEFLSIMRFRGHVLREPLVELVGRDNPRSVLSC